VKDPAGFTRFSANPYSYAICDPVNHRDLNGRDVEFCDGESGESLMGYLMDIMVKPNGDVNPEGMELMDRLMNGKEKTIICALPGPAGAENEYDENGKFLRSKVHVDPNYPQSLFFRDKGCQQASTPRALAHELGHAAEAENEFRLDRKAREMNVINRWENPVMTPIDGLTRNDPYFCR